jgi:hypothetical protein
MTQNSKNWKACQDGNASRMRLGRLGREIGGIRRQWRISKCRATVDEDGTIAMLRPFRDHADGAT